MSARLKQYYGRLRLPPGTRPLPGSAPVIGRDAPALSAEPPGRGGPPKFESQLGASHVRLDDTVLDRIDEIVAPGTNVNPADAGWQNPALEPAARRRTDGEAPPSQRRRRT